MLNTNVFSGNNAKRTFFSSQNEIVIHKTKSQKNSVFFAKLRNFVVGLVEKLRQDMATVIKEWGSC
jgi:hypothetical protein